MASINFPSSPLLNQLFTVGTKSWRYNGTSWLNANAGGIGADGPSGSSGAVGPTGPVGPTGLTGPAGADGTIGPAGPQGIQGATGATGATGGIGPSGVDLYTVSATAPSSPTVGDHWFDTNTGIEFVWINDGDSSAWVESSAGGAGGGSSSPAPTSKTASFTFAPTEADRTTVVDSASAVNATIPTNAAVAFSLGTKLKLFRTGTGDVKFVPDSGVTLRLPTGIKPKRLMGARLKIAADGGTINAAAGYFIPWDVEQYDTDGFHDNVTNNTRITVPSGLGITKITLQTTVYGGAHSSASYSLVTMLKNSFGTDGEAYSGGGAIPNVSKNLSAVGVPCVSGDYFEINYASNDTTTFIGKDYSSYSVSVEEIDAQGFVAFRYGAVEIEKIGTDEWIVTDHSALG